MHSSSHSFTAEVDSMTTAYVDEDDVTIHIWAIKNDLLDRIRSATLKSEIENCNWVGFTNKSYAQFVESARTNRTFISGPGCRYCGATFKIIEDVEKGICEVYITSISDSNRNTTVHGEVSAEFSVKPWSWWQEKNEREGNNLER
jgi:hypothetical protein